MIRVGFILTWYETGRGSHLSYDTSLYQRLAQSLADGKGLQVDGVPTSRRPPLYPLFIAFLLKFTPFPGGVQVVQALLGAISCVVLFVIGRELFGTKTGILASAIFAIDYISAREVISVLPEILFTFLLLASFYLLVRWEKENKNRWLVAAGFFAGLSLLTKDVLVFYFPFVALWFFLRAQSWRARFYQAAAFLTGLFFVVAPWVVRNCYLHRYPVLITVSSGHAFYWGNSPQTTIRIKEGHWEMERDTVYPTDPHVPPDPKLPPYFSLEADRYLLHKALDYVWKNPASFVKRMQMKILKMWYPYYSESPTLARWATAVCYIPVLIFGLFGIACCVNRWREFFPIFAFFVYMVVVHAVTISEIRYRYPVMPFLMAFASYGALVLWKKVHSSRLEEVRQG